MTKCREEKILEAWSANASAWIRAVEDHTIASRSAVTNQAIVNAILAYAPRTVLDIGCGEGWLVRSLEARDVTATGIDAIPALIEHAKTFGPGSYEVVDYDELASGRYAPKELFDAAVCNFSLFGDKNVCDLLGALPGLLTQSGLFFLQTLHPAVSCGSSNYVDGWRDGSWDGLGRGFSSPPAPWYFRTIDSWITLLQSSAFDVVETQEPAEAANSEPSSIIFVCRSTN